MGDPTEYAIVARDLGVKYDMRLKRRRTLRHTVAQLVRGDTSSVGRDEFWALRGLNFAVGRHELLALVGTNGSGKSTLLEAIAGVLRPDAGAVTTYGRLATLLTLGAGFEGDLSGRENIRLNGAFLGFSREKIEAKMASIIEFTELGQFIDAPVATYSNGMRTRLGFSIAAHLEPQVLLLDEILGVGDVGFREKSQAKLQELIDRADAIVVASHSTPTVLELATKVLWLDRGEVRAYGEPQATMEEYLSATGRLRSPMKAASAA